MNIFTQKGVNVYTLWCIFTPGQHSKEYPKRVPEIIEVSSETGKGAPSMRGPLMAPEEHRLSVAESSAQTNVLQAKKNATPLDNRGLL